MIIVKITGGLGNQLFQYSFGKYLSNKLNTKVCYDIQSSKKISNFTSRDNGLSFLNLQYETASSNEIKKLKYFVKEIPARIMRKIAQIFPLLFSSYYVEDILEIKTQNINFKDNCYYDGYWQSYNYLTNFETNILFDNLSYCSIIAKQDLIKTINNTQSISIHIRRGDYISIKKNSGIYNICDFSYYEKSISYLERKISNPTFFIFTDDIEWAKLNFKGNQYYFMEGNNPIDDLYLMSLCKHNIIANSTFSWWGAWLNQNRAKIVIAPKLWYNGKRNETIENLIPSKWIRM